MTDSNSRKCRAENVLSRHFFWIGLIAVAITFVIGLAISWRKWNDLFVDYGTQLYIPWRLLNGAVLYRDLFYFAGGPLSQYYNALLFKIFGVSMTTLAVSNIILTALMLLVIYRRFVAVSDIWTATTICLGIVLGFVFNQMPGGNFNFITPYSHEAVHGLILSIFAVTFLADWVATRRLRFAFAAGFCAGLVLLTKPDIFTALMFCTIVAAILFYLAEKKICSTIKSLAAFMTAGIIPPLFFFFYFLGKENYRESLRSTFFAFVPLQKKVLNDPLYQWCVGLDAPADHLFQMSVHFLFIAAIVGGYIFMLRHLDDVKKRLPKFPWLAGVLWSFPLIIWINLICGGALSWRNCGASFPLLGLCSCILICWHYKKIGRDASFPLLWNFFALALLSKMGLNSRVWQYGFALAMPMFAGVAYLLMWLLPKILDDKYKVPIFPFRVMACLILIFGTGSLFICSASIYAKKSFAVASGADQMFVVRTILPPYASSDGRGAGKTRSTSVARPPIAQGEGMDEALAWIEKNIPQNGTLAVLPHGVTMNYLSRRVNPTPCLFWDPNVLSVFGETNMTSDLQKNPPDYIFIVEWYEYRAGYIGDHYAAGAMNWIYDNYKPVDLIGNEPLKDGAFGIKIFKRISGGAQTNQDVSAAKNKN